MQYPVKNIRNESVPPHQILVYWLGGAGFMLKFPSSRIVCIDPYLSDCVERLVGFRRLSLAPLAAQELQTDLLLLTHDHLDHLDIDSFDTIIKNNPACTVIAGSSCRPFLTDRGVPCKFVTPGASVQCEDITITATDADHGDLCPESIGFIVRCQNRSAYFTGDTSLDEKRLAAAIGLRPEILVPSINPKFGNLGEEGAALLARKCRAKFAIPGHFGLFAEHAGDPGLFKEYLQTHAPQTKFIALTPGRGELI